MDLSNMPSEFLWILLGSGLAGAGGFGGQKWVRRNGTSRGTEGLGAHLSRIEGKLDRIEQKQEKQAEAIVRLETEMHHLTKER